MSSDDRTATERRLGGELKRVSAELRAARLKAEAANAMHQAAVAEVLRLEQVVWAIGADMDGRP